MYEWVRNETRNPSATLYSTNITLNRSAVDCLDNPWHVMLGIDRQAMQIAIRPVSQEEVEEGLVLSDELYKITVGRSYGRIANRNFCSLVNDVFQLNLSVETGRKYPVSFNQRDRILIIEVGKGEVE